MDSYAILTGLGLGLVGSLHCIGMCGPLALSLPLQASSWVDKLASVTLYNIGRSLSYAAIGLILGSIGQSLVIFNVLQYISVIFGIILLYLAFSKQTSLEVRSSKSTFSGKVKTLLAQQLQKPKNGLSYLTIGLLNGLLPCGMIYIAAGIAIASGNVYTGTALMFMFGMGTLPLMTLLMFLGKSIPFSIRQKINYYRPVIIFILGLHLIVRGLNIGIPYLSPKANTYGQTQNISDGVIHCSPASQQ